MIHVCRWEVYIPPGRVTVDGREVPALSRDEDEITVGYEVLSRFSNLHDYSHVLVADETRNTDFHTIYELLDLEISPVVFKSFSEGFAYALRHLPSLVTVIRTSPPAGSITFELSERGGKAVILKSLFEREFLGFLRTNITDEKALNELISDASASSLSKALSKFFGGDKVGSENIRIVSGFADNPKIVDKALTKLKLKRADNTEAEELRRAGFRGNLGTALALSKALDRCAPQERFVFIGGSVPGGILTLYMRC